MSLKIESTSVTGAFVTGVDLNTLSKEQVVALRQALGEHGVLFFRDQALSPEGHIAFAENFGDINYNRFFKPVSDYPKIVEVEKEPDQSKNIGEMWHTDHSYDQIPALGSVLVARKLPDSGGDTLFASMFLAFDALSDSLKERLQGLTAVHSSRHAFGAAAYEEDGNDELLGRLGNTDSAQQDAIHPIVIKHPISQKQAIYVNPDFTVRVNGVSDTESEDLLGMLYEHCQNEDFIYRFQWRSGSVAFWDNRATWHKALNDYPGQHRLMHRITVEGERLYA